MKHSMNSSYKPINLLVIDLETIGTKPGCIVTEVGAALFSANPFIAGTLELNEEIDYASSKRAGFKADKKTVAWWADKLSLPAAARKDYERYFANHWMAARSVKASISNISMFYNKVMERIPAGEKLYLVGNDIDFDKSILEHYFAATCTPIPWHYRDWLSLPTVVWLVEIITGIDIKKVIRSKWPTTHMALDDARQEAAMLEMAFDLLRNLTYTPPDSIVPEGYTK